MLYQMMKKLSKIQTQMINKKFKDKREFDDYKKSVIDFCNSEIKVYQQLYYFFQMNLRYINQDVNIDDCFNEAFAIIEMLKNMIEKMRFISFIDNDEKFIKIDKNFL